MNFKNFIVIFLVKFAIDSISNIEYDQAILLLMITEYMTHHKNEEKA